MQSVCQQKVICVPHFNSAFREINTLNEQQYPVPPQTLTCQLNSGTRTGFNRASRIDREHW
jgi:hypothetical protein